MNCDNCKFYHWYRDWCDKWKCEVDARSVHNCFEPYETPIRDAMVNGNKNKHIKLFQNELNFLAQKSTSRF